MDLFKKHPVEVQEELLMELLQKAGNTEYGQQCGFTNIRSAKEFAKHVPLQSYDSLKPYIIRLKHGESNLLWPGEIKWFAKSSGTTDDRSKFIPVSKEAIEDCHYKGGKDLLSLYYNEQEESSLFSGKTLIVGGSAQINHFSADSYYGDLSSIIIRNLPVWVENRRVPDRSIALMADWEEKLEKMARETAEEDVTNISGVPSWTLKLLERVMEIKNAKYIHEVWPNLQLFMHGGVSFEPYRPLFDKLASKGKLDYLETYNASEGFFGLQESVTDKDMLLMLDYGIYYEFIPLEVSHEEHPETLTLAEVETNVPYELVISTNAGLWRYRIGDVVTFTGTYPFRFIVTGRTKNFINAFGEEVMIGNAEQAIGIACQDTGAMITDYTAAPLYMKNGVAGAHEWIIEFKQLPNDLERFTLKLDKTLRDINSDYDAKRSGDLILQPPKVNVVAEGTFARWYTSKGKLGGQHKIPRLSNERSYLDEILTLE